VKLFHVEVRGAGVVVHAWSGSHGLAAVRLGGVPAAARTAGGSPVEGVEIEEGEGAGGAGLGDAVRAYLRGSPFVWDGSLDLRGVSAFQEAVLGAVRRIPWGQVRTYGEVARGIGRPGAVRAVGNALHRNPFPLVVPCHRVVREGGRLGGYACGPAMKRRLLAVERGQIELDLGEEAS
jgi:methylated-DNA-[protein]-cysteine S-methyltransferase